MEPDLQIWRDRLTALAAKEGEAGGEGKGQGSKGALLHVTQLLAWAKRSWAYWVSRR